MVNTFYLDDLALPGGQEDYNGLANDVATLWTANMPGAAPIDQCEVRIYRMDQAKPRPIRGQATQTSAITEQSGPREVALCLSFYGTNNVPRKRGRLFLGPFVKSDMGTRPDASAQSRAVNIANGIKGLGGVDVDWQVYSPTNGTSVDVTNFWVDNEWDTIRSRGLRGTSRQRGTTNEA